jgi:hypothetical protein
MSFLAEILIFFIAFAVLMVLYRGRPPRLVCFLIVLSAYMTWFSNYLFPQWRWITIGISVGTLIYGIIDVVRAKQLKTPPNTPE